MIEVVNKNITKIFHYTAKMKTNHLLAPSAHPNNVWKLRYAWSEDFFKNLDSLHARLNSHYEAWSYKKKNHKKITAYRKSV